MVLKATDDQVLKMAALAANASLPMGMGYMHYNSGVVFKPEDFRRSLTERGLFLDYVGGRMVKFSAWKKDGSWHLPDTGPDPEYQSWHCRYGTWEALAQAAGIEMEKEKS